MKKNIKYHVQMYFLDSVCPDNKAWLYSVTAGCELIDDLR